MKMPTPLRCAFRHRSSHKAYTRDAARGEPMTDAGQREREKIRTAARVLCAAVRPIKVLRSIDSAPELRARFFAQGAREMHRPEYQSFEPAPTQAALAE